MVMKAQPWAEALDHVVAQGDSGTADAPPPPRRARTRRRTLHPGHGPPARPRAVARLRVRPLRGHRRARLRARPRDPRASRSRSSASATTCSTAARWPCSRWSRRSAASCPASSATPSRSSRSRTRTACSSTRIYTKPREWNGREVPPILLSGNHAAIAAWRHEQRLARTAARRPDLLHASHGDGEVEIAAATPGDVPELNVLFKACWVQEALAQRHARHPGADREPRARCGRASTRRRRGSRARAAASSARCAPRGTTTTGSSAASASCRTCGAGDSADACSSTPSRPHRTAYARSRSSPGRAAPTTCGCTGGPATGSCPMPTGMPPGAVHLTKRRR